MQIKEGELQLKGSDNYTFLTYVATENRMKLICVLCQLSP